MRSRIKDFSPCVFFTSDSLNRTSPLPRRDPVELKGFAQSPQQ